jgi:site-specific DNA recombinase
MSRGTTATEYARVSRDTSGRLRSVEEQTYENHTAADEQGWTWLPTAYAEESEASASAFGTVRRIGFEALLEDLRSGAFPADVLVLWKANRGSRQMREWLDLIDALRAAGKLIHITSNARTYDVAKAKDKRDLQDEANEAEFYSGNLSEDVKRAARASARAGRWNGICPFGYKRLRDPETGKTVAQVEDPATAPFVREAYEHIAAGGSTTGLVRKWNATGETGKQWTAQGLRDLLLNPAYLGIRTHTPRSRDEKRSIRNKWTGAQHEACWPAIVEQELADKVQVILTSPGRRKSEHSRTTHLLAGIALCDVCGGRLTARRHHLGHWIYRCLAGGCVAVRRDSIGQPEDDGFVFGLDDVVAVHTIALLQREQVGPINDADVAVIALARQSIANAEGYLREVEQAARDGLSPMLVLDMQKSGERDLLVAKSTLRRVSLPDALHAALPTEPMTPGVWDAMTLTAKRRLLRALYDADGVVGPIRVSKAGHGRGTPVEDRTSFGNSTPQMRH